MELSKELSKNTFLLFFLLLAVLSFFIIKPFITAILAGIILAYIFLPIHKKINGRIKKKNISAFISTLIILLVVSLPFLILLGAITKEAKELYGTTKEKITQLKIEISKQGIKEKCETQSCTAQEKINIFMAENPKITKNIQDSMATISNIFVNYTSNFLFSIPKLVLDVFIMIFITFFCLRDGEWIVKRCYGLLPLKHSFKDDLKQQTSDVVFATVYGIVLVGIIQGFIATLGYFIFGITNPILLGFITTLTAILPFVGPPMVWIPVGAAKLIGGITSGQNTAVWQGIGLLVYGVFIISTIDNLLKPKIISERSKVHPAVILIGLFGGIAFMGPIGLVIGPLVLAMLLSFIKVYEKDRKAIFS